MKEHTVGFQPLPFIPSLPFLHLGCWLFTSLFACRLAYRAVASARSSTSLGRWKDMCSWSFFDTETLLFGSPFLPAGAQNPPARWQQMCQHGHEMEHLPLGNTSLQKRYKLTLMTPDWIIKMGKNMATNIIRYGISSFLLGKPSFLTVVKESSQKEKVGEKERGRSCGYTDVNIKLHQYHCRKSGGPSTAGIQRDCFSLQKKNKHSPREDGGGARAQNRDVSRCPTPPAPELHFTHCNASAKWCKFKMSQLEIMDGRHSAPVSC